MERTTDTTPHAIDAFRRAQDLRTVRRLPLLLEAMKRANTRMREQEVKNLVVMGYTLVEAVKNCGFAPFIQQADEQDWNAGCVFTSPPNQGGIAALGLMMQIKAMRKTPGLAEGFFQVMEERLIDALEWAKPSDLPEYHALIADLSVRE